MKDQYHLVKPGECIESIAKNYGFSDSRTISSHEKNKSIKEQRGDMSALRHGDKVFIPRKTEKTIDIGMRAELTLTVTRPTTLFSVTLMHSGRNPIANADYTLSIGQETFTGKTDDMGHICHAYTSYADHADLTVIPDPDHPKRRLNYRLRPSHLDPIEWKTGIQGRLKVMGYYSGIIDNDMGSLTRHAIKKFQRDQGIEITGDMCDITRKKLDETFDAKLS